MASWQLRLCAMESVHRKALYLTSFWIWTWSLSTICKQLIKRFKIILGVLFSATFFYVLAFFAFRHTVGAGAFIHVMSESCKRWAFCFREDILCGIAHQCHVAGIPWDDLRSCYFCRPRSFPLLLWYLCSLPSQTRFSSSQQFKSNYN